MENKRPFLKECICYPGIDTFWMEKISPTQSRRRWSLGLLSPVSLLAFSFPVQVTLLSHITCGWGLKTTEFAILFYKVCLLCVQRISQLFLLDSTGVHRKASKICPWNGTRLCSWKKVADAGDADHSRASEPDSQWRERNISNCMQSDQEVTQNDKKPLLATRGSIKLVGVKVQDIRPLFFHYHL